jgi:hypothetical protein
MDAKGRILVDDPVVLERLAKVFSSSVCIPKLNVKKLLVRGEMTCEAGDRSFSLSFYSGGILGIGDRVFKINLKFL